MLFGVFGLRQGKGFLKKIFFQRSVRLPSFFSFMALFTTFSLMSGLSGCRPSSSNGWNCGLEAPECVDELNERVCSGRETVVRACASSQVCIDGEGCVTQVCDPDAPPVCADEYTEIVCIPPGVESTTQACEDGVSCEAGTGCMPPVCTYPDTICLDNDQIAICREDGMAYEPHRLCSEEGWGLVCRNGSCVSRCETLQAGDSSLGNEYYAVDLPQYGSSLSDKDYGIIVSNTSNTQTAQVQIETIGGVVNDMEIPPQELRVYSVDPPREYNINSTGVFARAYRISSNIPVAAFQFNCLTTISAASTDASLLFHTEVLAKKYWVMDYTGFNNGNFIGVYAVEPDTTVTVVPSQPLEASDSGSDLSFGPTPAGEPLTVTLDPFQVLVVMTSETGVSLTGSSVEGSAPIGVFGGNDCTQVPLGTPYCDHLEQQIFPRQAIGTHYLVAKTHPRMNCDPPDYVRVLADVDGTEVTLVPPVAGPFSLNGGEWVEFSTSQSVEITSTNPILVGQFLRSSGGSECADEGDPAFVLQVPVEQFRCSYVFLTPDTYDTDFINIVAPVGAEVILDGEFLDLSTEPVGTGLFTVTSVELEDGPHVLESDDLVGVIVYGYGGPGNMSGNVQNVSYAYPAGLSLQEINIVE